MYLIDLTHGSTIQIYCPTRLGPLMCVCVLILFLKRKIIIKTRKKMHATQTSNGAAVFRTQCEEGTNLKETHFLKLSTVTKYCNSFPSSP